MKKTKTLLTFATQKGPILSFFLRTFIILALLVVTLGLSTSLCAQGGSEAQLLTIDEAALRADLDKILDSAIDSGSLVGLVFVVYKDGRQVYFEAKGYSDLEKKTPMSPDALFRLSSVSKVFTTMAAGALATQGALNLEAPVGNYLEAFSSANGQLGDGRAANMLVKHLLTHTAGLDYNFNEGPDGPYNESKVSSGCDYVPNLTLEENIERIAAQPLLYDPGSNFVYSVASDVLGAVVAKASGKNLPAAMESLIFSPLSLEGAGYWAKDPMLLTQHYRKTKGGFKKMEGAEKFKLGGDKVLVLNTNRALDPGAFPSGGCGMVGDAKSVITLLEAVRRDGGGIVDPQIMKWFYQDAIAPFNSSPGQGFGAGWAVVMDPGVADLPVSAGSINWGGVYGHSWYVDFENGLSVLLLTNVALRGLSGDTMPQALKAIYEAMP